MLLRAVTLALLIGGGWFPAAQIAAQVKKTTATPTSPVSGRAVGVATRQNTLKQLSRRARSCDAASSLLGFACPP